MIRLPQDNSSVRAPVKETVLLPLQRHRVAMDRSVWNSPLYTFKVKHGKKKILELIN